MNKKETSSLFGQTKIIDKKQLTRTQDKRDFSFSPKITTKLRLESTSKALLLK